MKPRDWMEVSSMVPVLLKSSMEHRRAASEKIVVSMLYVLHRGGKEREETRQG